MFLHWFPPIGFFHQLVSSNMEESMKMMRGNDESRADGKQSPWTGAGHPIHLTRQEGREQKIAVIG